MSHFLFECSRKALKARFRPNSASLALLLLAMLSFFVQANSTAQDSSSGFERVVNANSLDLPGKPPFHLRMSFQLYDLAGKPLDTGELEVWWASRDASRVTVTSKLSRLTQPTLFEQGVIMDAREQFLLRKLLEAAIHPIGTPQSNVEETSKTIGGVQLTCYIPSSLMEKKEKGRLPSAYCADPKLDALRIRSEEGVSTTYRNGLGTFQATHVSLSPEIAFLGRPAISGSVKTLQTFDPATSNVQLMKSQDDSFEVDPLPKSTVIGKLLRNVQPHFPLPISGDAVAGTVVLHMTISPAGLPTKIFTVASSTPRMANGAAEAAKKMVFEPSRLNGEPIELPAILISNFKTTPAP